MNVFKYTAFSPLVLWFVVLTVPFVLFMPDVSPGKIKAVLMALYFTLVILALFFEIAPPFVTRREAEYANKYRARKGMSYVSDPVIGILMHKVTLMRNESGKRERLPPFALWRPTR